jgi:ABC-type uncharacterized transport system involved in gliding motility auxiliary subunit
MKINHKLRLQLLMQNSFFVILFLILVSLVGYLSREYHVARDITQSNRNILTQGSINVLKQMKGDINVTVFASEDNTAHGENYRKGVRDFISRFQRTKPNIKVTFVSPAEKPKLAQEAGIKAEGELVVEYQKRSEHLLPPYAEQEMTNLLVRLSRSHEKPVMYLDGHSERNLIGVKNNDLGGFGEQLQKKGFKLFNPDLTIAQDVPLNGSMLVIASPQVNVGAVEVQKIKRYLDNGGNLLWLLDDSNLHGLDEIAKYIGLDVSKGMVIDGSATQYGVDSKFAFASQYGDHAITKNFMLRTMFPEARKISAQGTDDNGWKVSNIIDVAPNGWLENNPKELDAKATKPVFDEKEDVKGPINIAVALERIYGKKGQRVVVVGNANFLSNTHITSESNLDLGLNMVNWLAGDDSLITIQPKPLKDMNVTIPQSGWGHFWALIVFMPIFGVSFGLFQVIIPLALLVTGVMLWWKRRKA